MKRILNIMGLDMANALRDNIIIYMMIAPLLMALALQIFFPSFQEAGLNIAVEEAVGAEIIQKLEQFGRVEVLADAQAVKDRVRRSDAIGGLVLEQGKPVLLLEGNEPQAIVQSYTAMLEKVMAPRPLLELEHKSVGSGPSLLYQYLVISILMMTILLGAVVPGFNLIHEKETKAVKALNTSPMTIADYVASRGLLAVLIGLIASLGVSLILAGLGVSYPQLILALLASALLTTLLILVIGVAADNQITAIAVLKIVMPLYLALPLISQFVSEKVRIAFWILPNYWQFLMLKIIFIGGENFALAALLTLSLSILWFIALIPILKKKLTLR